MREQPELTLRAFVRRLAAVAPVALAIQRRGWDRPSSFPGDAAGESIAGIGLSRWQLLR